MKLPSSPSELTDVQRSALMLGAFTSHLMSFDRGETLRVIEDSGLTLSQMKVMLELGVYRTGDESGDAHLSALAESLGLSVSSISRAVDGLVRAGLLNRVEDPEDRRRRMVGLTEAGYELVDRVMSGRITGFTRFVESLDESQRRAFDEVIAGVIDEERIERAYQSIKEAHA